jgi:hypothetical protein
MKGKVSPKCNATNSPCHWEFVSNWEPMHRIPEAVKLAQTLKEVSMKNNSILNSLVLAKANAKRSGMTGHQTHECTNDFWEPFAAYPEVWELQSSEGSTAMEVKTR